MAGDESLPDRIKRIRDEVAALAARAETTGELVPMITSDQLTPDHPYSRVFGFERAKLLLNPALAPRRVEAARRRAIVLKMSLATRPLREIAAASGLSRSSIVKIRAQLREEGLLPALGSIA